MSVASFGVGGKEIYLDLAETPKVGEKVEKFMHW